MIERHEGELDREASPVTTLIDGQTIGGKSVYGQILTVIDHGNCDYHARSIADGNERHHTAVN